MEDFKKKEEERARELAKERARMDEIALLGKSIDQQQLEFMYKPPPGLEEIEEKLRTEQKTKQISAPVEGDYVRNINDIVHKPFGVEVRFVRCARCGKKGHISGDRECPLIDFNPQDGFHKRVEDPLYHMKFSNNNEENDASFIAESNLRLKESLRKNIEGVKADFVDIDNDPEKEFLDSLSKREKKKLLKYLLKKEKKEKKKQEKKRDESKKRKRDGSSEKKKHKRGKRDDD